MIRLLEVPGRKAHEEEDMVCLSDPNGAYLRREETDGGCRQIVVKGPMLGTPEEYAAVASEKLGRKLSVASFEHLRPIKPHDVRCHSIILRLLTVLLVVWSVGGPQDYRVMPRWEEDLWMGCSMGWPWSPPRGSCWRI